MSFNFQSAILSWVLGLTPWMMQNGYVLSGIICIELRETLSIGVSLFYEETFPRFPCPQKMMFPWQEASHAYPEKYEWKGADLYIPNHRNIYGMNYKAYVTTSERTCTSLYKTWMYGMVMYYHGHTNSGKWLNVDCLKIKSKNKSCFMLFITLEQLYYPVSLSKVL